MQMHPKVLHLAAKLAARVARGEVLYLHCWGGHGRTGTVVSIMLHLMYGLCADVAMERCQHVHDVRRIPISVGSPQTEAQREQVRRVVGQLVRRSRAVAAAAAAASVAANVAAADGANLDADVDGECASATAGKLSRASKSKSSCELAGMSGGVGVGQEGRGGRVGVLSLSPEGKRNANGNLNADVNGTVSSSGSGAGCGGRAVGGRRTWVRGRRQAFAQAPNGVGEPVSGWLHAAGDAGCGGQDDEEQGGGDRHGEGGKGDGGDFGKGQALGPAEEGSAGEGEADCVGDDGGGRVSRVRLSLPPSPSPSLEGVVPPETAAAAAVSEERAPMPRRKSFTEPYSKEDPSRGTRMSRLRRKSAPGKPPADELAEGDASSLSTASTPPAEGQGGEGGDAAAATMTAQDVLSAGGVSGVSVPGGGDASCAAGERCEGAGAGMGRGHAHAPSCGVGGARCAR